MPPGAAHQPILPLRRPFAYALELYNQSMMTKGDNSLGMVMSGLDVWTSLRSRGFLAKLVNEYAEGSYKMDVFGLDPLDDLTISLCQDKFGPVCAGVNVFLAVAGRLPNVLQSTCGLNLGLLQDLCSVVGLSSESSRIRYSISTSWIDLAEQVHLEKWPGTIGDPVPRPASLCIVVGIGWKPTSTQKPSVALMVVVDESTFLVVDGTWRVYHDSSGATREVTLSPKITLNSECVSTPEFATFSLAFAICARAQLARGRLLREERLEGMDNDDEESDVDLEEQDDEANMSNADPQEEQENSDLGFSAVSGFHKLFLAGESLAMTDYRRSLAFSEGQRLPDLSDLRKSRAVEPEFGDHLNRSKASYDISLAIEKDDVVKLVKPNEITKVAFWAPSARVEAANHLAETIGAASKLGYRVMSDEKFNPALSFVAKPLGLHHLTADCNDLLKRESCISIVETGLGSVVCIPGAHSGLLVPRSGKGIGESDCVPEVHEPCYPVLAAVGVMMVLKLDRDAGLMDNFCGMIGAEPANLVTLCGDEMIRAASKVIGDRQWSVREIVSEAERVVNKSLVGFVSRTAITVLVRAGCLPTSASEDAACYVKCVRQLYGVRHISGKIDCTGGVPLDGVTVFLGEDGTASIRLAPPVLRSQRGINSAFRIREGRLDLEGSVAKDMMSNTASDDEAALEEWRNVRAAEGSDGVVLWGLAHLELAPYVCDVGISTDISRGYCGFTSSPGITAEGVFKVQTTYFCQRFPTTHMRDGVSPRTSSRTTRRGRPSRSTRHGGTRRTRHGHTRGGAQTGVPRS